MLAANASSQSKTPKSGEFDWPQWQGPKRQANCEETGLFKNWSTIGPPLAWQAKQLGIGHSTPSVAGGHIYGMSQRGKEDGVWCLDEATGKEIWFKSIGVAREVQYGGSRCTPTVDGERLFALTVGGDLACMECATGKIIWKKNLTADFGGKMMSQWGYSESPLVDGDKLICSPGSVRAAIVALNKKTGGVVWKSEVADCGGAAYSSAVISEAAGTRQYVNFLGKCLVGVDAASGKLLWRYDKPRYRVAVIPTPLVKDDYIFASASYDAGSALLKIEKKGKGLEAKQVYFLAANVFQNHHGGVVLVGDHLYGGHGQNRGEPTCIDFLTGKIAWKEKAPASGSAAYLYADGHLIVRYEDGSITLQGVDPAKLVIKAKFRPPYVSDEPSWAHPVVANGRLYIRDQGGAHVL